MTIDSDPETIQKVLEKANLIKEFLEFNLPDAVSMPVLEAWIMAMHFYTAQLCFAIAEQTPALRKQVHYRMQEDILNWERAFSKYKEKYGERP